MTEAEWLACTDPYEMTDVYFEPPHIDPSRARKLRLFGCACVRRLWHWLDDERSRNALEVGERFAEGQASPEELTAASSLASQRTDELVVRRDGKDWLDCSRGQAAQAAQGAAEYDALNVARTCAWDGEAAYKFSGEGNAPGGAEAGEELAEQERRRQASLARDVFGNPPFRPASFDPFWRTPAVMSLARAAYAERALPSGELDPVRLAVLSDALEDAGCADAALLSHLRSPGPHVRGCWALDCLLAKE